MVEPGEEKTRSPFEIAGPLSQVFSLGVMAQKLNTKLVFERDKKIITNNKLANDLLVDLPPRKDWKQYYKTQVSLLLTDRLQKKDLRNRDPL